jgi:hypothetical protein
VRIERAARHLHAEAEAAGAAIPQDLEQRSRRFA